MSDFFDKYIIKNNNIENIIKDDSYMRLIECNIDYKGILYSDDEFNELEFLYCAIDDYANNNYFAFSSSECENYYYIKFNNRFYKIGAVAGQGVYYYIKLVNYKISKYIDYMDIIDNKRQIDACNIESKFSKIKFLIESLYEMGLSVDVIENNINGYLYQIKNNNVKIRKLNK